jgi:hypothetical protein
MAEMQGPVGNGAGTETREGDELAKTTYLCAIMQHLPELCHANWFTPPNRLQLCVLSNHHLLLYCFAPSEYHQVLVLGRCLSTVCHVLTTGTWAG